MEDSLEDELIYDTLLTHLNLISKLMVSLSGSSTSWTTTWSSNGGVGGVGGTVAVIRLYLGRPEICVACALVGLLALAVVLNNRLDNVVDTFWYRYWPVRVNVLFDFSKSVQTTGARVDRFGEAGSSGGDIGGGGGASTATGVGVWERRGPNVGVYAMQGRRNKMEDRFSVLEEKEETGNGRSTVALYGVFDGHGGDMAADFVEKTLFKSLMSRLESQCGGGDVKLATKCDFDFVQLLSEEILAVDKQLLAMSKASKDYAGTTALVAVVYNNKLVVANVGDSRGVVCDRKGLTIPLSFDHKPHQLKEQKRIKEAGGLVTFNGVWRVAGILATSRALGDFPLKDRKLIIADPDVLTFNMDDLRPQFMILASDGLWDMFSNEEAVTFIKAHINEPDHGAKSLVLQAYQRGSLDNITVVVVSFPSKLT